MELNLVGYDALALILYYSCDARSFFTFHESTTLLSLVCKQWLKVIKGNFFKIQCIQEIGFFPLGRHPLSVKKDCKYHFVWRDYIGNYNYKYGPNYLYLYINCEARKELHEFCLIPSIDDLGDYLAVNNKSKLTVYYKLINHDSIVFKTDVSIFSKNTLNFILEQIICTKGGILVFGHFITNPITYLVTKVEFHTSEIKQKLVNLSVHRCGFFGLYYEMNNQLMLADWEKLFSSESSDPNFFYELGEKISEGELKQILPCIGIDLAISDSSIFAIGIGRTILWSLPLPFPDEEYTLKRFGEVVFIYCDEKFHVLMDPWSGKIICTSELFFPDNIIGVTTNLDATGYTLHLRSQ